MLILRRCAIRRYLAGDLDVLAAQNVIGLTHIMETICWGDSCQWVNLTYEGTRHGRDLQRAE
jgi:hypothetical protein